MTKTFYNTGRLKAAHSDFGGKIYPADFGKKITLAEITARIIADQKFDLECGRNRNSENRREDTENGEIKM